MADGKCLGGGVIGDIVMPNYVSALSNISAPQWIHPLLIGYIDNSTEIIKIDENITAYNNIKLKLTIKNTLYNMNSIEELRTYLLNKAAVLNYRDILNTWYHMCGVTIVGISDEGQNNVYDIDVFTGLLLCQIWDMDTLDDYQVDDIFYYPDDITPSSIQSGLSQNVSTHDLTKQYYLYFSEEGNTLYVVENN